jgi:hypothetical protein
MYRRLIYRARQIWLVARKLSGVSIPDRVHDGLVTTLSPRAFVGVCQRLTTLGAGLASALDQLPLAKVMQFVRVLLLPGFPRLGVFALGLGLP